MDNFGNMTMTQAAAHYREFINQFLTIGGYADYLHWDDLHTARVLEIGKIAHALGA